MAFMEGCPQGLYYGVVPLYATKYYAYSGADPGGGVDWVSSHPPMGYIVDAND